MEKKPTSAQAPAPSSVMSPAPGVHEITIKAVVTRADGTVEDLGVISRTKQPLSKKFLAALRAGGHLLRGA